MSNRTFIYALVFVRINFNAMRCKEYLDAFNVLALFSTVRMNEFHLHLI